MGGSEALSKRVDRLQGRILSQVGLSALLLLGLEIILMAPHQ